MEQQVARTAPATREETSSFGFVRNHLREYGILVALIAIVLFFQFVTGGILLRPVNLTNLVLQDAEAGRAAVVIDPKGDLVEARRLQERLVTLSRALLGPENPDTLVSMINLATTLHAAGDIAGAQALADEVAGIRDRTVSTDVSKL